MNGKLGASFGGGGIVLEECYSAVEAIAAIMVQNPDIILLDHQLSEGGNEGFEVVEWIKKSGLKIEIYTTTKNGSAKAEYEKMGIGWVDKMQQDLAEHAKKIEELAKQGVFRQETLDAMKREKAHFSEGISDDNAEEIKELENTEQGGEKPIGQAKTFSRQPRQAIADWQKRGYNILGFETEKYAPKNNS
ncbi:MAG: hypothetical protein COY09_00565 [Candidatus Portnoybacteria bacterium CG_4_10_14_0_2_um_filter_39_11]|uniref:Response regulatory domain-containing protein n=1 Tax=Candidatus Portnoybacteria bacterium CG_4_10_14_0_2_um_filter_39_11 TaxID=1974797 RepID=A0A2M7UJT5_9BACT|nr:MAG: hypothetical protein COY09_00565 [Candidatus Portnoybacteria bacterium CG_4_10_14_0_2_um_filter_39_11]